MGIFSLFSDDDAKKAAADQTAAIQQGIAQGNSALTAGQTTTDQLYGQAGVPFTNLSAKLSPALGSYIDAIGGNGQAGIDRATTAFKSMPGYQGGLTTGIDQVNRTAAARGDVGGGNTSADEIKFASDYDAGKYGNYVSNLAPVLGGTTSAAAGQAGVLTSQARTDANYAGTKANLAYTGNSQIGQAQAQADLAPYQASQNFWGALLGTGTAIAKAYSGSGK